MLEIDFESAVPIYQQIRDQIILNLVRGELKPGEELPSVRVMSDELGVNMMTLSKAYQMLKDEGITTNDRRRGTKIVENFSMSEKRDKELETSLSLLLAEYLLRENDIQLFHQKVEKIIATFDKNFGGNK